MKILFTLLFTLILGLGSPNLAQAQKIAYVSEWSNARDERLVITPSTIQYGSDKPLGYRDVTKVTDGSYFNLEVTEPGKHDLFSKFIALSSRTDEDGERMKMTLFNTSQNMYDGRNLLGEITWYRGLRAQKPKQPTRNVKVFLVALGDGAKTGRKIGCGDRLIAVNRRVQTTGVPLHAALQELLAIPRDYNGGLNNFWANNNLKIKSVSISRGVATVRLTGEGPAVAGVCDEPRITGQIEATARQFPSVRQVKVFVNNRSLANVIR